MSVIGQDRVEELRLCGDDTFFPIFETFKRKNLESFLHGGSRCAAGGIFYLQRLSSHLHLFLLIVSVGCFL